MGFQAAAEEFRWRSKNCHCRAVRRCQEPVLSVWRLISPTRSPLCDSRYVVPLLLFHQLFLLTILCVHATRHTQGLTEGPTQQYCSLIKSCKRLQQLSMPHCCYQDTYKPLQILYTHCRNLTSLDFGYAHSRPPLCESLQLPPSTNLGLRYAQCDVRHLLEGRV
jgi:hypothetical protein